MNEQDKSKRVCRHCGYHFYQRTEYPKHCKSCQQPYPLGFPPAEMAEQLRMTPK